MYTVGYFINKFEKIPESKWTTGVFKEYDNSRCALGHCMTNRVIEATRVQFAKSGVRVFPKNMCIKYEKDLKECEGFCRVFKTHHTKTMSNASEMIISINNGTHPKYQQPTPKQRILAALYDIKKMQEPTYTDITKELAILPDDKIETDLSVKELNHV